LHFLEAEKGVMSFFGELWDGLANLLSPPARRTRQVGAVLGIGGSDEVPLVSSSSSSIPEPDEAEAVFLDMSSTSSAAGSDVEAVAPTQDEIDRAFVAAYKHFMRTTYGRDAEYFSDLYCNMLRKGDLFIMSKRHPIAESVLASFQPVQRNVKLKGERTACVAYDVALVDECMDEVNVLFREHGHPLRMACPPRREEPPPFLATADNDGDDPGKNSDDVALSFPPPPPPTITIRKDGTSKKSD
jgi:hypothetical protein